MDELEKKEERNKRIGWITAVAIQLVLLVLFYFLVAWKAPNPPIPEYGIELGFTTSAGASSSTPPPESSEEEPIIEEEIMEEEQQPLEEVEETESEEQAETEVETTEEIVTEEVESPVKVEESKPKPVDAKPVEKPTEKEEEKKEEQPTEKPVEETDTGDGQGEEEEEPVIDQRAIYGSQGNSEGNDEGASLSLAGWVWDFKPKPDDTSDQTGKIVYRIVVDSDGYLVKIEVVTSTVSPVVERKYRQSVQKLTFSKTVDNNAAALSTGTITFIITSR